MCRPGWPREIENHSEPNEAWIIIPLSSASAALGADRYLNINFGNGADGHSPVGVETILGSKP
ncbi:MAG: hypothetical protein ACI9VS_003085, partial [Candidatus Binatia bacterium]